MPFHVWSRPQMYCWDICTKLERSTSFLFLMVGKQRSGLSRRAAPFDSRYNSDECGKVIRSSSWISKRIHSKTAKTTFSSIFVNLEVEFVPESCTIRCAVKFYTNMVIFTLYIPRISIKTRFKALKTRNSMVFVNPEARIVPKSCTIRYSL